MSVYNQEQLESKPTGGDDRYLNKFENDVTKVRVMDVPITGYQWWVKAEGQDHNVPVRVKEAPEEVPANAEPDNYGNYVKYFESFIIWNYDTKNIQIMQVVQTTIQDGMMKLDMDFDDLRNYDIKINKEKKGERIKYSVSPTKPSDIPLEAAEAFESNPVNLNALYDGEDPFASKGTEEVSVDDVDENLNIKN